MKFKMYSRIKLTTKKYELDGVPQGTLGIILDDYNNGDYEVQFLDKNGEQTPFFSLSTRLI